MDLSYHPNVPDSYFTGNVLIFTEIFRNHEFDDEIRERVLNCLHHGEAILNTDFKEVAFCKFSLFFK